MSLAIAGHVLLVEDSRTQALVLTHRLRAADYHVVWETSAESALIRLLAVEEDGAEPFDVVVTDVGLPGRDGMTLLADIKENQRLSHLPVLVVSADIDEMTAVRCIEAGADDFLSKPVNPVLLLARVRSSVAKNTLRSRERDYARLAEFEKRRAEMLLFDVLPAHIATRMMREETLIADHHDNVTVLFADLVGFTAYSSSHSATEVVQMLDGLFGSFDDLCASYGVEKIKTLGDGYMAAGGLRASDPDGNASVAELALAMLKTTQAHRSADGTRFDLRIGIHIGPVIAGVIGRRRPVYDLWGDTVNIASRMESTAEANAIQVTGAVAAGLGSRFVFESRGPLAVRGKGQLETWYLRDSKRRRRPTTKKVKFKDTVQVEAKRALLAMSRELTTHRIVDSRTGFLTRSGLLSALPAMWRSAAADRRGVHVILLYAVRDAPRITEQTAELLQSTFRGTDQHGTWDDRTFITVGVERAATEVDTLIARLERAIQSRADASQAPVAFRIAGVRLMPDHASSTTLFETSVGRQVDLLHGALLDDDA